MLPVFRKARNELMNQKNFKQYLAYAIGEIVLIVVGILLALKISNWNDARKANRTNHQLLAQLLEENNVNKMDLLSDQHYRDTIVDTYYNFHTFLNNSNIEQEVNNLQEYLASILRITYYKFSNKNLQGYIDARQNVDSEFIKELILLDAYQNELEEVSKASGDRKLTMMYDFLLSDIDFESLEVKNYDHLKSVEFKNTLLILGGFEEEVFNKFESALLQQNRVDSLINEVLN
ncbi:MAG: hypothetical protein KTR13_03410 [Saprospiraceae bacterium]|nr:hypothetical protein [Saprospiraceae bacterium]